jgi:Xaa-Pro aminopeptidase
MHHRSTPRAATAQRREALRRALGGQRALLGAGSARPRNYAAHVYGFRAAGHFLYLVGAPFEGGFLLLDHDGDRLYLPEPHEDDPLWHGPSPSRQELEALLGLEVRWTDALSADLAPNAGEVATLPTPDLLGCEALSGFLGRPVRPGRLAAQDEALADAMIELRLTHDEAALAELRAACAITREVFAAGREAVAPGRSAWEVRAAMQAVALRRGVEFAYAPIISTRGEVLHNPSHDDVMHDGDLLLLDVGAESLGGWASDVTRVWPVSGKFSATQRALYDVVLASEQAAIGAVAPGVRYREVHLTAARVMAQGLVELGILRGGVEELVEQGAHALFFPHGVGHLLGLDVHDMEDLGDRAGYAPGRARSAQFGLGYLRLDRDLRPGMVVTIEPGFYQVPSLLGHPRFAPLRARYVREEGLARFADVRGIRIEDDVLVTAQGHEVLTDIPRKAEAVSL